MRQIILLIMLITLAACGGQPAQPAQPGFQTMPATISSVTVEIAESLPVQVFARIQGEIGDGCSSLGAITQRREGNVIEVDVTINRSNADACTMIMQMLDQRVQLEGDFPPGEYIVRAGDKEARFSV